MNNKKPIIIVLVVMVVVLAGIFGYYWYENHYFVSTDDAYVDYNILQFSPGSSPSTCTRGITSRPAPSWPG